MIQESFEKNIIVSQYECDFQNRMKPSAIMRQVQQVSTDHCDALGITAQVYEETHTAFLLAKLSLEVYKDIRVGEAVKLVTRPALPVRAVYNRYTGLYDEDGALAAAMDSRWILIDTRTRRILRRPPEGIDWPFIAPVTQEHSLTMEKPDDLESVGTVKVTYSRVDQNRHLNNTEYADIICDCLPIEHFQNGSVKKLVLSYHHEARFGEELTLYRAALTDAPGYYLCGMLGEQNCFEANIRF